MTRLPDLLPEIDPTLTLTLPTRALSFLNRIARIAGVDRERIAEDLLVSALQQEAETIVNLVQGAYPEEVTAAAQAMNLTRETVPPYEDPKLTLSPQEIEQAAAEHVDLLNPDEN